MSGTVIVLIAAVIAFAFLWVVFYKKDASDKEKVVRYVCHACEEKNCDCHKTDNGVN